MGSTLQDLAFVFPGQGSQTVGMGKELAAANPAARSVFAQADESLGYSLSRLIWQGEQAELDLTENAQPAILTVAVAVWRVFFETTGVVPLLAAGHSLGEYAALVCAGALDFSDAVRAVHLRGQLMQKAVPIGVGAMSAVTGLASQAVDEAVAAVFTDSEPVAVAAYNGPEQTTIAGSKNGVEAATVALTQKGAARIVPLRVSAPFHCPLMKAVEVPLRQELTRISWKPMNVPVISNVEGKPNQEVEKVVDLLIRQLTLPVRWVETVQAMRAMGVTRIAELGPGHTLAAFVKRIDRSIEARGADNPASLSNLASWIAEP